MFRVGRPKVINYYFLFTCLHVLEIPHFIILGTYIFIWPYDFFGLIFKRFFFFFRQEIYIYIYKLDDRNNTYIR